MSRVVDEHGFPVDCDALKKEECYEESEVNVEKTSWEPVNILVNYVPGEDPNEDSMTVIKLNGSHMEFKSFGGWTANDIYKLLIGKEK